MLKNIADLNLNQKVSTVIPLLVSSFNFIVYTINDLTLLTSLFSDVFLSTHVSLYSDNFYYDYYMLLHDLYLHSSDLFGFQEQLNYAYL